MKVTSFREILNRVRIYLSDSPFFQQIWNRVIAPWFDGIFLFYMLVGVMGIGALGVWYEVVRHFIQLGEIKWTCEGGNCNAIINALSVFYPAVMGVSSLQILLGLNGKRATLPWKLSLFILAFMPAILFGVFRHNDVLMKFWFYGPVFCSIFAILTCCFANSADPNLRNDKYAAMGGENVGRKLNRRSNPVGMKT